MVAKLYVEEGRRAGRDVVMRGEVGWIKGVEGGCSRLSGGFNKARLDEVEE